MPANIRLAGEDDAEHIQAIYAPYVRGTCISFETEPPAVEDMRERVRKISGRWPWLVCEQGGEILGYAYGSEHRARAAYQWSVDVAVYVRDRFHRAGIGRALYAALFPLLSLQGFFNAYAGIALPNPGSVGLHEAMGFRPVGTYRSVGYKLGAWRDVGWWHLELQHTRGEPVPPCDIQTIQRHPEWKGIFQRAESHLHL